MSDSMKIFYTVIAGLPSLFTLIMAGVLAYEKQASDVWGWFLFVGFLLGIFLFGGTLDRLTAMERK